jgi:uncharacterized phosphosugar-binding protein
MEAKMLSQDYFTKITELVEKIRKTQTENIQKAAKEIAPRLEKGGILFVFGSGHSHVMAEELQNRAGGLIQVRAILPYELTMDRTPNKAMYLERTDGYAEILLKTARIRPQDALIVISNSGRNAVPVEMAHGAKQQGIFTIAVTNLEHSKGTTPRNKIGKKLYEVVDIALDNCGPLGDAAVQPPGKPYFVGPVSTIVGAVLLEGLVCNIAEIMIADGIDPPILRSANLDGSDEYNHNAVDSLKKRFPELIDYDFHL